MTILPHATGEGTGLTELSDAPHSKAIVWEPTM